MKQPGSLHVTERAVKSQLAHGQYNSVDAAAAAAAPVYHHSLPPLLTRSWHTSLWEALRRHNEHCLTALAVAFHTKFIELAKNQANQVSKDQNVPVHCSQRFQ